MKLSLVEETWMKWRESVEGIIIEMGRDCRGKGGGRRGKSLGGGTGRPIKKNPRGEDWQGRARTTRMRRRRSEAV